MLLLRHPIFADWCYENARSAAVPQSQLVFAYE